MRSGEEACDYMLRTILEDGPASLIWLVENDRIEINKAFRVLANSDPIEALKDEFAANGWVQGMKNANDLFLIPRKLFTTKML